MQERKEDRDVVAFLDGPDLSAKIVEHYHTKGWSRARTKTIIDPTKQGRFEPHFSYVLGPGVREWFFPNKALRDEFVKRHEFDAIAYPRTSS